MTYGHIAGVALPLSRLILGTMVCVTHDLPHVCNLLDHFVDLGGNTLDTAHIYGQGVAERAVGEWMALRGNRAALVIVGKGAHHDARGPRVSADAIAADLDESLARLRTDYIDLYLLHRDDPAVPAGDVVEWLNAQHRAGRIRAFGGSNWSTERLTAANAYAREHGLIPFAAGSPNLSLAVWNEPPWSGCIAASTTEKDWYIRQQFPLLAWSSQAQGFFTGRFAEGDRANPDMMRTWYNPANFERLRRAQTLALRYGVTANAIALAYVLCQPLPVFALIGPHIVEELDSSATALTVTLTPEELGWLNLESDGCCQAPPDD